EFTEPKLTAMANSCVLEILHFERGSPHRLLSNTAKSCERAMAAKPGGIEREDMKIRRLITLLVGITSVALSPMTWAAGHGGGGGGGHGGGGGFHGGGGGFHGGGFGGGGFHGGGFGGGFRGGGFRGGAFHGGPGFRVGGCAGEASAVPLSTAVPVSVGDVSPVAVSMAVAFVVAVSAVTVSTAVA